MQQMVRSAWDLKDDSTYTKLRVCYICILPTQSSELNSLDTRLIHCNKLSSNNICAKPISGKT